MRSAAYKQRDREKKRQQYAANPDVFRSRVRTWQARNRDKVRAKNAEWAAAHPDAVKAKARKWRAENPERAKELKASWRRANPDKAKAQARRQYLRHTPQFRARKALRRAREELAAVPLTHEEQAEVIALYAKARALTELTGEPYHVDHIKPLAKGGLHHPSNLQVLRGVDNLRKGAKYG